MRLKGIHDGRFFPRTWQACSAKLAAGRRLPPVEKWHPAHCGDIDIRIARDGTWFHEGTPVGRRELVRLFSTILRKDAEDYVLVTPAEKMRIVVEDAPFLAVLLRVEGEGREQRLIFTTNVGDETVAGRDNPIRVEIDPETREPAPYVHVRARAGGADFARSVYYQLAEMAVPGEAKTACSACGAAACSFRSGAGMSRSDDLQARIARSQATSLAAHGCCRAPQCR